MIVSYSEKAQKYVNIKFENQKIIYIFVLRILFLESASCRCVTYWYLVFYDIFDFE